MLLMAQQLLQNHVYIYPDRALGRLVLRCEDRHERRRMQIQYPRVVPDLNAHQGRLWRWVQLVWSELTSQAPSVYCPCLMSG